MYDAVRRGEADIGRTQVWPSPDLTVHVLPTGRQDAEIWSPPYIHLDSAHDRQIPDVLARRGIRLSSILSLATEQAILAPVARQLGFALLPALALTEVPDGVSGQALPWPVQRSYDAVTSRAVPAAV